MDTVRECQKLWRSLPPDRRLHYQRCLVNHQRCAPGCGWVEVPDTSVLPPVTNKFFVCAKGNPMVHICVPGYCTVGGTCPISGRMSERAHYSDYASDDFRTWHKDNRRAEGRHYLSGDCPIINFMDVHRQAARIALASSIQLAPKRKTKRVRTGEFIWSQGRLVMLPALLESLRRLEPWYLEDNIRHALKKMLFDNEFRGDINTLLNESSTSRPSTHSQILAYERTIPKHKQPLQTVIDAITQREIREHCARFPRLAPIKEDEVVLKELTQFCIHVAHLATFSHPLLRHFQKGLESRPCNTTRAQLVEHVVIAVMHIAQLGFHVQHKGRRVTLIRKVEDAQEMPSLAHMISPKEVTKVKNLVQALKGAFVEVVRRFPEPHRLLFDWKL